MYVHTSIVISHRVVYIYKFLEEIDRGNKIKKIIKHTINLMNYNSNEAFIIPNFLHSYYIYICLKHSVCEIYFFMKLKCLGEIYIYYFAYFKN